ncbi:hypothetical protein PGH42_18485 [Legionella pneumophila]|nr:hypothetical protein PGH42_18485 [Legionella pneumophila]
MTIYIKTFVNEIHKQFPNAFLHWEDFVGAMLDESWINFKMNCVLLMMIFRELVQ